MTIWQRVKLFFRPPEAIQPECFIERWCAVSSRWLAVVEQRFAQQEKRAAAMALLEKNARLLKGEGLVAFTCDMTGIAPVSTSCQHLSRVSELVQMCADCGRILRHDDRVMIEPERYAAMERVVEQWHKLGLYMRQNYSVQIERGDHAGVEDADVIIGYLSEGRVVKR